MRTVWTILAVAGGLVLLVLVGVAIVVWTVDVNQFVSPIQTKVRKATGRDLAMGGGTRLEFGLEPQLVFEDVHLGNAPWAKEKDLASIARVEAKVALLPLLQRRFEVVRLALIDPVITLETGAGGKGNWEFSAGSAPGESGAAGANAASVLASFGIGQVEIENGSVTYRDDASGSVTRIVIERFAAQARTPASPIYTEFRGKVDDVPVSLTGNFGPLDMLLARRSPYPVRVEGRVADRQANVSTNLHFGDGTTRLEELSVGMGSSKATGDAVVVGGTRKKLTLRLSWPSLAVTDLLATARPVPASARAPKVHGRIFSDEPVQFAALAGADVDGDITIGELVLADGSKLSDVRVHFTLRDARLDASELQANTMGGTVHGSLKVDASNPALPIFTLVAQAKGLDLAALLAAGGAPRQIRGGKTDVTVNLTTRGKTPRQWAHDVDGNVLAVVGPATVVNSRETESSLGKIAQAVNPFRSAQAETEIRCVVVRLPMRDGIAHVDRSIAAETRELGVLASGTVDLGDETLDLALTPRSRIPLPVDLSLAGLVRVRGALASPTIAVDAKATAAAIAELGAATGKGGLAALGAALAVKPATAGGANPCDVALGRASAGGATAAPAPTAGTPRGPLAPDEELGKALGKLLGR